MQKGRWRGLGERERREKGRENGEVRGRARGGEKGGVGREEDGVRWRGKGRGEKGGDRIKCIS